MSAITQNVREMAFVVMPIGKRGTKTAETSREVYDCIIRPAVESRGLRCVRADEIVSPGSIIDQIRHYAAHSKVVVADISERNPNVLYEVGLRHGANGKAILMARDMELVPSDLKMDRVIHYDLSTPRSCTKARQDLENVLDEVLKTASLAS